MKLSERSYPHPVVGNKDDFPGAGFQATVTAHSDKENIYLEVDVICSSDSVLSLIQQKKATYVLHVECTNTIYRNSWNFAVEQFQVVIPASRVYDKIEVNLFACALSNIHSYSPVGAHSDYGDTVFDLKEGDIIAVSESREFSIESEDALARIGSIMLIEESVGDSIDPMRVEYNGQKISIILNKNDFNAYKILKGNETMSNTLSSIIVLPVLVQALYNLKDEGKENYRGLRWSDNLWRRLEKMGVIGDFDPLDIAQRLLESPVSRALKSAQAFIEGAL